MQQLFHSKDEMVARAGVRKAAHLSSGRAPSYLHLADPRLGESLTLLPSGLVDEVGARQQETLVLVETAVTEVQVEAPPRGRPERLALVTYDAVGDHGVPVVRRRTRCDLHAGGRGLLPGGLLNEVRARQQETLVLAEAVVAEVHVEAHPRGRTELRALVAYDAVGDHGVTVVGRRTDGELHVGRHGTQS